jgi:hypothetical protein
VIFYVDGDDSYYYDVGVSDDVGNQSSALSTICSLTHLMYRADFSHAVETEAKAAGDAKAAAEAQAAAEAKAAADARAMSNMLMQIEQLESASKTLNEVPIRFCTLSSVSPSLCSNVAHRPASKLPPLLTPSALPPPSCPRCIRSTLPRWNK